MGRSGGCCLGANCTAPPCPSGNCCFVETNDSINISNQNSLAINHHLDYYNCEDDVTENCCLSKQYSLFNKGVKCGDIQSCDSTSVAVPSVYSADGAFALLKHDGSVVTWGTFLLALRDAFPYTGKAQDSKLRSNGENPHKNIVDIVANQNAFLFLDKDGWYTTWGDPAFGAINGGTFSTPNYLDEYNFGCESNASQDCITSEQIPQPRSRLKKGSIIPINTGLRGNDIVSTSDQDFLPSKVASRGGFAGISLEGKLVIYYSDLHDAFTTQENALTPPFVLSFGGNNDGMELELPAEVKNKTDIVEVASFDHYVAARDSSNNIFILELPRVIGSPATGFFQRNNLRMIGDKRDTDKSGSVTAFDALQIINFLSRYGEGVPGGLTLEEFEEWAEANPGVASSVYSSKFDVNKSGTVTALDALLVVNGVAVVGGPSYDSGFSNVKKIYSNKHAFAFLLNDGKVFVWGDETKGGNTGGNQPSLVNIKEIYNTDQAFLAHREDNKIIVWGDIDTAAGPASDFYDEVLDVFPSRYAFGLSFIKITQEGSNDVLTHKFDILGSIVPNKRNLTSRRDTNYGLTFLEDFYSYLYDPISYRSIPMPSLVDINSYTVASYEGPYDFKSPPLDVFTNAVTFKRDFYAGYYAFHFVTSTLDDDTSKYKDHAGRFQKDTIYFYSIGQRPVDGEKASHDFANISNFPASIAGSISSAQASSAATNILYINDDDAPGTPRDNPLWRPYGSQDMLTRLTQRDAKTNNSFVKGGKSYVFNEKATAMLLPLNDTTYSEWTISFRSLPSDKGNYYLLTNGHVDYGGYQTSFADTSNPQPSLWSEYNFVALFSNKYAFCGIQFFSDDNTDSDTQYEIKTWGVREFGGSSEGVDFSNTFTEMKNIALRYDGCHPDYCDQDFT